MTNYWAIAIGINQYQHFQPLMYAERDAEALYQFWVTEAGIPAEHCLLLGDSLPPPGQAAAGQRPAGGLFGKQAAMPGNNLPTQETIVEAVTDLCQRRLHADDVLWFFFSGYGVQHQGKDYLLPIEADPGQVPSTAIALETLFGVLQAAPTDNILVVLDINRSQGSVGGVGVGRQVVQLAQEAGLALMLSSRPEQFSHETVMLRQGLFTAALLEGLRHQVCLTPEQMVQFVRDRLPELSQHHWRPRQDIVAIVPDTLRYQLMLPGKLAEGHYNGSGMPLPTPTPDGAGDMTRPESPTDPMSAMPVEVVDAPELTPDERTWQRIIRYGGIALLVLLGLVVARNLQTVLSPAEVAPAAPPTPTAPVNDTAPADAQPEAPPTPLQNPSPEGQTPAPLEVPTAPAPDLPPPPTSDPNELPAVGSLGGVGGPTASAGDTVEANRRLLDEARAALTRVRETADSNQVSEIYDAIQQVRQIQPGQPLYDEAQAHAERWSGMILDMAVGRAARRNGGDSLVAAQNYQGAIAAAQLVPPEYPELYSAARRSIAVWGQDMMDLALLHASEGALGLAIDVARYVPANTPAYAEAQRSIQSWQAQLEAQTTPQQTADLPSQ